MPYKNTNHLAALPMNINEKPVSVKAAGDINGKIMTTGDTSKKIMLTYQTTYESSASATKQTLPVKLTATNYTFPYVMGYAVTDGSFFSEESQERGSAVAVLNQKAAFDLFGSINAAGGTVNVNGKTYTVSGVTDDTDDTARNIYVPAQTLGETTASGVIVSLNGTSEEQAKNELKAAYVDQYRFHILNLGLVATVVTDKVYLSAILAAMGILIIIFKKSLRLFKICLSSLSRLRQNEYLQGILRDKSGTVFKLAAAILFSVLIVVSLFWLLPFATEKFLVINTVRGVFDGVILSCFTAEISGLRGLYQLSNILFAAFVAVFAAFTVVVARR